MILENLLIHFDLISRWLPHSSSHSDNLLFLLLNIIIGKLRIISLDIIIDFLSLVFEIVTILYVSFDIIFERFHRGLRIMELKRGPSLPLGL